MTVRVVSHRVVIILDQLEIKNYGKLDKISVEVSLNSECLQLSIK